MMWTMGVRIACLGIVVGVLTGGCKESADPVDAGNHTVDRTTDSSLENDAGDTETAPEGPVTLYEGFEERYILTADDDPKAVCRVRYDLRAVGEPSVPCYNDVWECLWDVTVEKSNPSVVLDVDGACANSDLALDDATIAAWEGEQMSLSYAKEYMGHPDELMRLNEGNGAWEAVCVASWSADTGMLSYDRRDGFCNFGAAGGAMDTPGICGIAGEAHVSE